MTVYQVLTGLPTTENLAMPAHRAWGADRLRAVTTFDAVAGAAASVVAVTVTGELTRQGLSIEGIILVAAFTVLWPLSCLAAGGYARSVAGFGNG